jgi:hypothetical protein
MGTARGHYNLRGRWEARLGARGEGSGVRLCGEGRCWVRPSGFVLGHALGGKTGHDLVGYLEEFCTFWGGVEEETMIRGKLGFFRPSGAETGDLLYQATCYVVPVKAIYLTKKDE